MLDRTDYMRRYYLASRESLIKRNLERTKFHKSIIDDAKNCPCADCGLSFPSVCMDFDHVRGEKLFTIGNNKMRALKLIKTEIEKCDVVCANCHRIRTYERAYGLSQT